MKVIDENKTYFRWFEEIKNEKTSSADKFIS
jgi:hypothetical protein